MGNEMTALSRYNANMEGEIEPEPVESLRFFLSLAITGQDWIDVEQFIDGVRNQLASRDAEVAELHKQITRMREALSECSCALNQFDPYDDFNSLWQIKADFDIDAVIGRSREALSATEPHDRY
jgi:hypothetical protein